MGVNEGSEVCGEKAAGIGELREREREELICEFQPCSLQSVSLRSEMRLADGSVW